jgi:hypothetical protein
MTPVPPGCILAPRMGLEGHCSCPLQVMSLMSLYVANVENGPEIFLLHTTRLMLQPS